MKKPNTPTETPTAKAKTEKPAAVVVTEAKLKKASPTQKTPKKSRSVAPKPAPKTKTEQLVAIVATETMAKKPSPAQKSPNNAKAVAPKAAPMPEMTLPERIGLTAGSIWNYLDSNGATPVAKLVRELPEEEKIVQRSIGWLAQEGKITLDTIDRVETIGLTG